MSVSKNINSILMAGGGYVMSYFVLVVPPSFGHQIIIPISKIMMRLLCPMLAFLGLFGLLIDGIDLLKRMKK